MGSRTLRHPFTQFSRPPGVHRAPRRPASSQDAERRLPHRHLDSHPWQAHCTTAAASTTSASTSRASLPSSAIRACTTVYITTRPTGLRPAACPRICTGKYHAHRRDATPHSTRSARSGALSSPCQPTTGRPHRPHACIAGGPANVHGRPGGAGRVAHAGSDPGDLAHAATTTTATATPTALRAATATPSAAGTDTPACTRTTATLGRAATTAATLDAGAEAVWRV